MYHIKQSIFKIKTDFLCILLDNVVNVCFSALLIFLSLAFMDVVILVRRADCP